MVCILSWNQSMDILIHFSPNLQKNIIMAFSLNILRTLLNV
jgi:hypothetical protein